LSAAAPEWGSSAPRLVGCGARVGLVGSGARVGLVVVVGGGGELEAARPVAFPSQIYLACQYS
jgi:hypothetical protein